MNVECKHGVLCPSAYIQRSRLHCMVLHLSHFFLLFFNWRPQPTWLDGEKSALCSFRYRLRSINARHQRQYCGVPYIGNCPSDVFYIVRTWQMRLLSMNSKLNFSCYQQIYKYYYKFIAAIQHNRTIMFTSSRLIFFFLQKCKK